ncbi:hypothetical protein D9M70_594680 [compost metagenome]
MIVDTTEADLGAQNSWSFPAYLGGPFSAIEQIGLHVFVARCDDLSAQLGARFSVPPRLRELAASGTTFHRP